MGGAKAGRWRSFARQGLSDEASRPLVLVGVCGDDSALWRYGRKPPLTHTLPHYHVTWRIPAAAPLGDAFDLAHPPLPVLRTGAARRLWKALCPFWEGCCCCRLRATGNAITPSPRDGGSYRVALQQYKSFRQDSTLDLCQAGRRRSFARQGLSDEASRSLVLVGVCGGDSALWGYGRKPPLTHTPPVSARREPEQRQRAQTEQGRFAASWRGERARAHRRLGGARGRSPG